MVLSRASLAHSDLAGRLLATEIGREPDAPGLPATADRVCQKLSRRLSTLVKPAGSQAILSRALHLARREFSFLEGVHAGTVPEACFEGLGECIREVDAGEAGKGLLAVLGIFLDLLVGFIGEDLTLRLLLEVWPTLPLREPSQPGTSDGQEAAL